MNGTVLKNANREKRELRAEIARLQECLGTMDTGARIYFKERDKLRAEIKRLRREHTALELENASWKQSSGLKLAEIKQWYDAAKLYLIEGSTSDLHRMVVEHEKGKYPKGVT